MRGALLPVLTLLPLFASCGTVRSVWRSWRNPDLAGREAPPLDGGTWLLPPDRQQFAREAPADWAPPPSRWRLVAFMQPH